MKKIVFAALGATLLAGVVADSALAAQHLRTRGAVQAPVRNDEGFRSSYNAYGRSYDARAANSGLAEGGAVSAPAGR